jgi:hypothetical protein
MWKNLDQLRQQAQRALDEFLINDLDLCFTLLSLARHEEGQDLDQLLDVVMFVAYLDGIYSPIDSLNEIAVSLQQYMASLLRAVRLLDSGPTELPGADLPSGPGESRVPRRAFRLPAGAGGSSLP